MHGTSEARNCAWRRQCPALDVDLIWDGLARRMYDVIPVAHYQQLLRGLADPRVRFAPPGVLHDHEIELKRHAVRLALADLPPAGS